ncbi:glycosyltransferase [Pseudomonas sp. ZM23]|uniref:Glycosyltransferase n=1 Tax=Pseudomonas triclosanedens TaxID=2961893 RepID=A0ABY6ZVW2_9PSED|nr:glycosyltransferase [Pseudomonas triclosanedens]MCP8465136.1 glycosyltransferase [Pseudomonas triclosanedens]MCP8470924.1 glycosyltransferase [Pseudomonas triclosanedens]MCP8476436.1 glycosyltransferase [Pseudomonas triclosanedens]WAI49107.1 glycosyltransferase [Pseudomonas triclosanedens]
MSSSFPVSLSGQTDTSLTRQALYIALAVFVLCLLGAHGTAVVGFDSRFVLFAKEMLRHGPGVFPTTYGEPYPDYPATSTFLTYLLSLPFGRVDLFTAWLPTALASGLIAGLTYRLAAAISRSWGLLSLAMLLLTATFLSEARAVSLDQMVAAVGLLAFFIAFNAQRYSMQGLLVRLLLLLLLGFALRGPLGLVVPAGMVCSQLLLDRNWRWLAVFSGSALALLLACSALLLVAARSIGGEGFVGDVLRMQVTGRLDGSAGASDALYYFRSSLGNYALAFPLAIPALALLWRRRDDPAARLVAGCALAALVVMAGLSLPQAKKARYILAMAPLAAIIATYPFHVSGQRLAALLRGLIQGIWLVLPGLLMLGIWLGWRRYPQVLQPLTERVVLCALWLVLLQLLALSRLYWRNWRAEGLALGAALALWGSYIMVIEPAEQRLYDSREFSLAVDAVVAAKPAPLVLYGMGRDARAIKFMVNLEHDAQPLFAGSPDQLASLSAPYYLMLDEKLAIHLKNTYPALGAALFTGRFDNDRYCLLRVDDAGVFNSIR